MYKGGEWLLHKLHDFFHILCVCTYYIEEMRME